MNFIPEEIKLISKIGLAKCYKDEKETLNTHNNNLLKSLITLHSLLKEKCHHKKWFPKIRLDLLEYSIYFHDIGKCEKSWLENKEDKYNKLAVRHEILSFLVCYEYLKKTTYSNLEKLLILQPIINHHNKAIIVNEKISREIKNINLNTSTLLINNNYKIKWLHNLSENKIFNKIEMKINNYNKNEYLLDEITSIIEELSENITQKESYIILLHNQLLCASDQLASGHYEEKEIRDLFEIDYKIGQTNKKLTPKDYQKFTIDNYENEEIFMIHYPPGMGKTLIPEFIAEKTNKNIIHAIPKNIIAEDIAEKYLKNIEEEKLHLSLEDNDCIKSVRNKFHWIKNKSPVLFTTPDNLFLMSQGYKRPLMFLKILHNGIIVHDEYHDCLTDNYRTQNLFEMIDKFVWYEIPIIFMSGTPSTEFVKELERKYNGKN